MSAITHISSVIVLCLPERIPELSQFIEDLECAEMHATDPAGKMVVVLETDSEQEIIETINQIESLEGALNVSLVFHQIDELDQTISLRSNS